MSVVRALRLLRSTIALALVVSLAACASTKQVALPSPELSAMNLKTHGTKAQVTLRDGRQLEVEGLQVGVESARGEVRRERTVDASGRPDSKWQDVEPGSTKLALASDQIARVKIRTGRVKGGLIGFVSGLLVGGGAGMGIGYAAGTESSQNCSVPAPGFPVICGPVKYGSKGYAVAIGAAAGALVFSVIGTIVGSRGKERTYVIEPQVAAGEPSAMPSAEPSAMPSRSPAATIAP